MWYGNINKLVPERVKFFSLNSKVKREKKDDQTKTAQQ